jgi:hypothetical protein
MRSLLLAAIAKADKQDSLDRGPPDPALVSYLLQMGAQADFHKKRLADQFGPDQRFWKECGEPNLRTLELLAEHGADLSGLRKKLFQEPGRMPYEDFDRLKGITSQARRGILNTSRWKWHSNGGVMRN